MKFSQREVSIIEDVYLRKKGYQEGTSERCKESQEYSDISDGIRGKRDFQDEKGQH